MIAKILQWFKKRDELFHTDVMHYVDVLYANLIIDFQSSNNLNGYIILSWVNKNE